MKLVSTRPPYREVSLREAVLDGPTPDGALYLPVSLPTLDEDDLRSLDPSSFPRLAERLALRLLEDPLGREPVRRIVSSAFDFPVPVVPLGDDTWVLELFHGPTGSFKDFGARFLAQLLTVLRRRDEGPVVILVATSGDTGGAVADAVSGLEGVKAVVLYPRDRLSPVQLRQIVEPAHRDSSTDEGVVPVEVSGSFDDCQRMVKEVLADPGPGIDATLTSANSVNIGRLIPQAFYYVHGWASLPPEVRGDVTVSVPSGNLGNLTAGVMAGRMGVPFSHYIAASNANAAMCRYYETGDYPGGPTIETLSSAMDVARPSNLERLVAIFERDMKALGDRISATRHSDEQVLWMMDRVYRERGYLLDPHTAVGYLGLEEHRRRAGRTPGLVLATADPAKFPETVERATGRPPPEREDWEGEASARAARKAAGRSDDPSVRMAPDTEALRELLRAG